MEWGHPSTTRVEVGLRQGAALPLRLQGPRAKGEDEVGTLMLVGGTPKLRGPFLSVLNFEFCSIYGRISKTFVCVVLRGITDLSNPCYCKN